MVHLAGVHGRAVDRDEREDGAEGADRSGGVGIDGIRLAHVSLRAESHVGRREEVLVEGAGAGVVRRRADADLVAGPEDKAAADLVGGGDCGLRRVRREVVLTGGIGDRRAEHGGTGGVEQLDGDAGDAGLAGILDAVGVVVIPDPVADLQGRGVAEGLEVAEPVGLAPGAADGGTVEEGRIGTKVRGGGGKCALGVGLVQVDDAGLIEEGLRQGTAAAARVRTGVVRGREHTGLGGEHDEGAEARLGPAIAGVVVGEPLAVGPGVAAGHAVALHDVGTRDEAGAQHIALAVGVGVRRDLLALAGNLVAVAVAHAEDHVVADEVDVAEDRLRVHLVAGVVVAVAAGDVGPGVVEVPGVPARLHDRSDFLLRHVEGGLVDLEVENEGVDAGGAELPDVVTELAGEKARLSGAHTADVDVAARADAKAEGAHIGVRALRVGDGAEVERVAGDVGRGGRDRRRDLVDGPVVEPHAVQVEAVIRDVEVAQRALADERRGRRVVVPVGARAARVGVGAAGEEGREQRVEIGPDRRGRRCGGVLEDDGGLVGHSCDRRRERRLAVQEARHEGRSRHSVVGDAVDGAGGSAERGDGGCRCGGVVGLGGGVGRRDEAGGSQVGRRGARDGADVPREDRGTEGRVVLAEVARLEHREVNIGDGRPTGEGDEAHGTGVIGAHAGALVPRRDLELDPDDAAGRTGDSHGVRAVGRRRGRADGGACTVVGEDVHATHNGVTSDTCHGGGLDAVGVVVGEDRSLDARGRRFGDGCGDNGREKGAEERHDCAYGEETAS